MQPEYDLRRMRIVRRGPGHEQKHAAKMVRVTLDPDIAEVFNNDQSVNEALRTLLRALTAIQSIAVNHLTSVKPTIPSDSKACHLCS